MKKLPAGTPIEVWFQDEMRVGQKNGLVYQWAKKGTRPRQPKDQRYENAYVFGAVCPARDTGVALVMPRADTEAMQKHLDEIGRNVTTGAHALLILDKAGWHTTDKLEYPPISPSCPCRPPARNSTQPRTSGSTCARPISRTACSRATTPSSTPARTPGGNSSPKPAASPRSQSAIGRPSVSHSEGWYYIYADPTICRCAYVGTPEAYQAYQNGTDVGASDASGRNPDGWGAPELAAEARGPVAGQVLGQMGEDDEPSEPDAPSFNDYVFGGMRTD